MNAPQRSTDVLDALHYRNVNGCANALRYHGITSKYLDDIERQIGLINRSLSRLRPDIDFLDTLGVPPHRRLFILHKEYSGNHYQPSLFLMAAHIGLYKYAERRFPILINGERGNPHLRKQYEERTKYPFGSTEIDRLLSSTLVFLKVLEKDPAIKERLKNGGRYPFYVPDKRGLYLCHMENIPEAEQDPPLHIFRWRMESQIHYSDPVPVWEPKTRAFINSYVASSDMTRSKRAFFERFHNLIDEETLRRACYTAFNNFVDPIPTITQDESRALSLTEAAKEWAAYEPDVRTVEERLNGLFHQPFWPVVQASEETLPPRSQIDLSHLRKLPWLDCLKSREGISPKPPQPEVTALKSAVQSSALPGLGKVPFRPAGLVGSKSQLPGLPRGARG